MERLRRAFVLVIAGVIAAFAHSLDAAPVVETPPASLQGAWRAVSMAQDGELLRPNEVSKLLLVISDKKITMRVGQQVIAETTYTLDTKSKPAAIDMTFQGQATLGIYQQTGDRLRICLNDQDKGRPREIPAILGTNCQVDLSLSRADGDWGLLIHVLDADGGNPRALVNHPEFIQQGSPEWSADGSKIAFDAYRPVLGETWSTCHLLTCQADGKELKDLGRGAMPSWSPDGKRLTFSSYEDPRGVMIANADGTGRELLDEGGWGAQWCPQENKIAYTKHISGDGNAYTASICVRDMTTKESRTVLDDGYRQVYWGMAWSPDGRWIAFKGVTQKNQFELVVVSADGQKKDLRVLATQGMGGVKRIMENVSWSPDSKQVFTGLVVEGNAATQLFAVDIDGKSPPKLLPKQAKDQSCRAVACSPDGKHILVSTRPKGR